MMFDTTTRRSYLDHTFYIRSTCVLALHKSACCHVTQSVMLNARAKPVMGKFERRIERRCDPLH